MSQVGQTQRDTVHTGHSGTGRANGCGRAVVVCPVMPKADGLDLAIRHVAHTGVEPIGPHDLYSFTAETFSCE